MATVSESQIHVHFVLPDELPQLEVDEQLDFDVPGLTEPTLPFAEWIRVQASLLRITSPGEAGQWLASKIDELAELAVRWGATRPEEWEWSHDNEEHDRDVRLRDQGYISACNDAPHSLLY